MGTIATVTIGSDSFSVYALTANAVNDATAFHNGRLGAGTTAWNAATTDNRGRALVVASDWIDRALGTKFSGAKTVAGQARAWPRDGATCNGTAVTDGTTPDDLAHATFWLAGQILVDNAIAASTGQGSNIRRAQAGSATVSFFRPTINYLKCYFGGSAGAAGVATGTSTTRYFDACDFRRDQGLS
jgi:hypothetical protein